MKYLAAVTACVFVTACNLNKNAKSIVSEDFTDVRTSAKDQGSAGSGDQTAIENSPNSNQNESGTKTEPSGPSAGSDMKTENKSEPTTNSGPGKHLLVPNRPVTQISRCVGIPSNPNDPNSVTAPFASVLKTLTATGKVSQCEERMISDDAPAVIRDQLAEVAKVTCEAGMEFTASKECDPPQSGLQVLAVTEADIAGQKTSVYLRSTLTFTNLTAEEKLALKLGLKQAIMGLEAIPGLQSKMTSDLE